MARDTIQRSALGNPIGLGYLYNACTEKSCNVSLLKDNRPPPNCIVTTEIPSTESNYVQIKSTSDKFCSLNVPAELKISLLCGLVSVNGSGKYFRDEKTSFKSVSVSLINKITTKHEFLAILDEKLRENIHLEAFNHRGATHVVTGITWGANLIVTAEYKNEENRNVREIAGMLQAELKKHAVQIEGPGSVDIKSGGNSESSKFQLKIFGDVLIPDQLPQTIEGAVSLVAELSALVHTYNDGKGVPVLYELTSLEDIQSYFSFNVKINNLLHTVEEQIILRLMSVFDEISNAKQKLNDFCDDVDKYENHLPDDKRTEIRELKHEAAVAETEFRGQLKALLIQVRSGQADASELEDLKKVHESGPFSPSNVLLKLRKDFHVVRKKIEDLQRFTALGFSIVPKQAQSLANKLLEFKDKQVYVLFGESEAIAKNGKLWEDHISALRTLAGDTDGAENSKVYVDLDSAPHLTPKLSNDDNPRILLQRFNKRGKCVDEDAYKTFLEERAVNYAVSDFTKYTAEQHNNVATLELPCPKFYKGRHGESFGRQLYTWTCYVCKDVIDWGFDGFFYCSCGKGPAQSYKFRCVNSEHDNEFYSFPEGALNDYLDELRPIKELNIVILSQTGFGKSTWINGILNYMTFSSLDEAVDPRSELLYAIPMSFNIGNGKGETVEVKVGEDKNEHHHKKGTSATQSSRPYTLRYGNQLVRLIDTPGICDTRGIDQDKKNVENILGCLQKYQDIHGICILLLPNISRIGAAFTFCIKEILAHLHKGASQNIVFCYTNSRGYMYQPAETAASLQVLLDDINKGIVLSHETQYFMDNESIRFLAAYKNKKVNFPPDFVELFAGSWTQSAKETARLFKHISDLPPHATKQTVSLNQVRRMINDLGRPLGETAKNIEDNIRIAEEHKNKLQTIDLRNAELEKELRIPVTNLKTIQLGHPRTVCGASKCVKYYKGKHGQSHCVFSQICHDKCGLPGVPTGSTNERQLRGCAAMRYRGYIFARCIHCGCSWNVHMHQTFDVELSDDFEEIPQIRDELDKEKNAKRTLEEAMVTTDGRIFQLKKEKAIIAKTSARFAVFLKRNAVCLFNDATADYLDWLIENEKTNDKIAAEQRAASLEALMAMKRNYEEQKKVLEQKLENAEKLQDIEGEISIEKIEEEIQGLYNLPINGSTIKTMMDEAAKAVQNSTYASEIQLDTIISKARAACNRGGVQAKRAIKYVWNKIRPNHD